jgi:hypothetical protein
MLNSFMSWLVGLWSGSLQWHDLFIPQPLVLKQFSSNSSLQIELLGSRLTSLWHSGHEFAVRTNLLRLLFIDQQSSFQAGYYKFVAFRSCVTWWLMYISVQIEWVMLNFGWRFSHVFSPQNPFTCSDVPINLIAVPLTVDRMLFAIFARG